MGTARGVRDADMGVRRATDAAQYVSGVERIRRDRLDVHRAARHYGIGAAVLGKLSAKQGTIALVIAGLTLAAVAVGVLRRRRSPPGGEQR